MTEDQFVRRLAGLATPDEIAAWIDRRRRVATRGHPRISPVRWIVVDQPSHGSGPERLRGNGLWYGPNDCGAEALYVAWQMMRSRFGSEEVARRVGLGQWRWLDDPQRKLLIRCQLWPHQIRYDEDLNA